MDDMVGSTNTTAVTAAWAGRATLLGYPLDYEELLSIAYYILGRRLATFDEDRGSAATHIGHWGFKQYLSECQSVIRQNGGTTGATVTAYSQCDLDDHGEPRVMSTALFGTSDKGPRSADAMDEVTGLMRVLPARHRKVFRKWCNRELQEGGGINNARIQTARDCGISRQRVEQLLNTCILPKLRRAAKLLNERGTIPVGGVQ